jgi:hypothetical protein
MAKWLRLKVQPRLHRDQHLLRFRRRKLRPPDRGITRTRKPSATAGGFLFCGKKKLIS